MRHLSKMGDTQQDEEADVFDWGDVVAGPWFAETLKKLRTPEASENLLPGEDLKASLRPYQQKVLSWLYFLTQLKLGGCLADDMGLRKTIQIISLLLLLKNKKEKSQKPHLLVVPSSLLGNWQSEIEKFAPTLKYFIAHTSFQKLESLLSLSQTDLGNYDIIITTYGSLAPLSWLLEVSWGSSFLMRTKQLKMPL